jgi:hypothetical protein
MTTNPQTTISERRTLVALRRKTESFIARRDGLSLAHEQGARRATERAELMLSALPHARIRGAVLYRIEHPKQRAEHAPSRASVRRAKVHKPLSAHEREDAHCLAAMACERLGIVNGTAPTFEQWKLIFRAVRAGLGIDRKAKRDERTPVLSLDPALLAQVDVPALFTAPRSEESDAARAALAPMVRDLIRWIRAAYTSDTSRKRRAAYRSSLNVVRSICAVRLGSIESVEPVFRGASPDALYKRMHDFRKYIQRGQAELERRAGTLRAGEYKSLECLATLAE